MTETTRSRIEVAADGHALTFQDPRLLVEGGPDAGKSLPLRDLPVVVGRGTGADLRLTDPAVSREHALLHPRGAGWEVRDLGGKGGVSLAGVRVDRAPLPPDTPLQIGNTVLVLAVRESRARAAPPKPGALDGIRGDSAPMRRVRDLLPKMAAADLPVLVLGESGTGKEAAARALHELGPRAAGPFVVADCTLLGEREHLRSELFGHVPGAFTGAGDARPGAFVRADGGTLFLDEIGELPPEVQAPLLRVLEEGEVRPLGAEEVRRVRVRVLAATNRDLDAMVAAGTFRGDLYYRLAALVLELPPLRERGGDVLELAEGFLPEGVELSPEAREALRAHPWPGNVRELKAVLGRAAAIADGPVLGPADLGLRPARPGRAGGSLEEALREAILDALRATDGNKAAAARRLGMGRSTLFRHLKRMGLT